MPMTLRWIGRVETPDGWSRTTPTLAHAPTGRLKNRGNVPRLAPSGRIKGIGQLANIGTTGLPSPTPSITRAFPAGIRW